VAPLVFLDVHHVAESGWSLASEDIFLIHLKESLFQKNYQNWQSGGDLCDAGGELFKLLKGILL